MFKNTRGFLFAAFTALALSACGGGSVGSGGTNNPNPNPNPGTPSGTPARVVLASTTNVLRADADTAAEGIPLTAIVTDANGITVSGATVAFSITSGSGALIVPDNVSGDDGTVTGTLTTGGTASFPRTISVVARIGSISSAVLNISVVDPNTPAEPVQVSRVDLFASAPQLFSDEDSAEEGVTLTAVITNDSGNVVANVPVAFSLVGGSIAALEVERGTTDNSGTAAAVLRTSGNASPRTISVRASVTVNGTTIQRDISVPVVVRASALVLTASANRLPSDDSVPVTITARATDQSGAPLSNVPVSITVSSGSAVPASVVTNASGVTPQVVINTGGDPTPRSITVTARAPGVAASTVTVSVVPAVSTIRLLSSSSTLKADANLPEEGVTLTAVLTSSSGSALVGETVTFTITSGDGVLQVLRAVTDTSGSAAANLTTLNTLFPRTITVRASAQGKNASTDISVVNPNTPTTPVQVSDVQLFASAPQLRADADTAEEGVTFTAVVTNVDGNVVSGVPVNFNLALVTGTGAAGNLQELRGTTDATGTATALLTTSGNTAPRTVRVRSRVTVGGSNFEDTLEIPVVAAAATVNGTISSARLPNNNSTPVTARARAVDENGNPLANVPVTFFVSSGEVFSSTTVRPQTSATVTTNSAGETGLVTIATAGDPTPRIITVTMTAPGATADTADIAVVPAIAATGLQLRSTSTSLKADADTAAEALPITAVLVDDDGNLIAGEPVTFRISSGSGALQVVRSVTDESGTAVANLTTGGNATFPRSITVEARAQNRTATRTINVVDPASPVTPLPVAAVDLFASAGVLFSDADTADEGVGITAVVTDNNGNVVANVPVSFSLSLVSGAGTPGNLQVTRNTTDATGTAGAILTTSGNTSIRTVRVTARVTVNGAEFTDTVDVSVVGKAAGLTATFNRLKLFNDNSAPVTVVVRAVDASGNGVGNVPVSLNVTSGSLSATEVTTNSSGQSPTITLTTGGNATPRTIRFNAIAAGGISVSADVEVVPAVSTLQLTSSSPRLIDGPTGGSVALTALARASDGTVLADIPVRFSVSGTGGRNGAVQPLNGGLTGADGRAQANLTLGSAQVGDVLTVTATFDRQPPLAPISSTVSVEVVSQIASLDLLASSSQLSSAANSPANGVTLTALVKDPDQNVVADASVNFAIVAPDNGLLTPIRLKTDASGTAQAVLTTSGDPTDRTIRVRATSGSSSKIVTISVVGTRLSITGPNTAQEGVPAEYVATLVDDAGRGIPDRAITITTDSGSVATVPAGALTNVNGQITFRLTAGSSSLATLTATALGEVATQQVSVTNDSLVFDSSIPLEANLNTDVPVKATWTRSGAPVAGRPITFSTSRGAIDSTRVTVTTNALGEAETSVRSSEAGVATIIARGVDNSTSPASTPTVLRELTFNAVTPRTVTIEAEPTVIGPNQQSTVTAVVRDATENLVKNVTVNFKLVDTTGGRLSAGSAITDGQGRASVLYTSSSTASALDGVKITASVTTPGATSDTVAITVGSRSARIVLGTGNTVRESGNGASYELPYTAIVTDNAGNAAPGATLRLTLNPRAYYKGYYVANTFTGKWEQVITAECVAEDTNDDGIMQNEDTNGNGVLDPGEDSNGNGRLDQEDTDGDGQLDPSNPGTPTPSSPTLDATGQALFDVVYPQDRGNWVGVRLTARASVSGTEAVESARFDLPVLAADLEIINGTPPGQPSPFGILSRCDLDDTLVPYASVPPSSGGVLATEPATGTSIVNVQFALSKPFDEDIVLRVSVDLDDIALDERASTDDYSLPSNQVTFPAGTTTATLPVLIRADALDENVESFNVRIADVLTNNALIAQGTNQRAVVTIRANP